MTEPFHTIKTVIFLGVLASALLLTSGCSENKPANQAPASKRPAHLVELFTPSLQRVQHTSLRSGTLKARKTIRIFNQEEGTLTALPFHEGDQVKKGDILLKIDDKLLRAEFDKARATLAQAQQDLKRLQTLRKKKLVADDEVNRAKTALNVAEAEQRLLATRLSYTSLTAPIDGLISERLAEIGDVAPRYTHLLTIIDVSTLITEVAVSDLLIDSLAVGDAVSIRIDALPGQVFKGQIIRIHPTLNPSTRNGIVEIILNPPPKGAKPGQFCRVELRSHPTERLLIPFRALRQSAEGSYVYLVDENNKVSQGHVTTGLRIKDSIEILDGLQPGQRIVIKGFLGLKAGKTVRVAPTAQ